MSMHNWKHIILCEGISKGYFSGRKLCIIGAKEISKSMSINLFVYLSPIYLFLWLIVLLRL